MDDTLWGIPEGFLVCHHCDNPSCVSPKHLFLGTNKDNSDDKVKKNRQSRLKGEMNPGHKLTKEKVAEIREKYKPPTSRNSKDGYSIRKLSKEYNMGRQIICNIINNKNWTPKHYGEK